MIIYIGNVLSSKGLNPPPIEGLKYQIRNSLNIRLTITSNKRNKLWRFIHMNYVFWVNLRKISLVFIDVYSTQAFYYALYFSFLSWLYSIKYIPIIHGGDIKRRIRKSQWMTKFVFSKAAINISPSKYILNIFLKNNFKVEYIPNSIDLSLFQFKHRKKIGPRLFWVRSFHNIYNPQMAIYVLKKISEIHENVTLTMVGPDKDGSLQECQELSKKYNIENKVRFTGYLIKKEWIKIAESHDIFLNTSNIDNMPISILEIMAMGIPIISTNVGGVPYMLSSENNALLVDPNDIGQMVHYINLLIKNPSYAYKLSMNAFQDSKQYSIDSIFPKWEKIINTYIK